MLTPQEVSEHAFAKASFGGYNMAMVDEFLDLLTSDYTALYNENALLKSKMKVLVDKVEEYRSTEEAMRKALMTAQRMAEELIREAEQKKADILQDAEQEAHRMLDNLTLEVEAEEYRLRRAQQSTAAFVNKVRALHAQEAAFLDGLQELCPPDVTPEPDPVQNTVDEIDDNVQRLLAQAMMDATAENLKAKEPQEEPDLEDTAEFAPVADEEPDFAPKDAGNVSRIDFGELQFGRDYEIK